jgi:hypothetical protein
MRARLLQAGVDAVLFRPLNVTELLALTKHFLTISGRYHYARLRLTVIERTFPRILLSEETRRGSFVRLPTEGTTRLFFKKVVEQLALPHERRP